MLKIPIGSDDAFLLLSPRFGELPLALQVATLAATLLVPLGLIAWLYRWEMRLISSRHAWCLLAVRFLIVFVLWVAVALQPHFADIYVQETTGRVRVAVDLSSSMEVTDMDQSRPRKALVHEVLSPQGKDLLRRLSARHGVEILGFHEDAFELQGNALLERLSKEKPSGDVVATNMQLPLAAEASRRDSPLLGIVLLSDGKHNVGAPPFKRAEDLGRERIPIYPVVIGSREPPSDLMILDVQGPTKVLKGAVAPFEVRVKAANLPEQELTVELQIDGKQESPEHRKVIQHDGREEVYTLRFQAAMEEIGTRTLSIRASSAQNKEITLANNTAARVVRVSDDKVKVLLVDGEARWEYHYLAVALLRDPKVAVDRVVFNQPRIGGIKEAELEKAGLAKTKLPQAKPESKDRDPLLEYDCIILGDVSPDDLPIEDRRRLEKYVSERGGTIILAAGKRFQPMAYANLPEDPIVKLLPITEPRELKIADGFTLRAAGEGMLQPFLQLEPDSGVFVWPELPRHYWGIVGKRKPAASILLTPVAEKMPVAAKESSDSGIFVMQNYGFGRVLYIGLDSTWRWRYRVGDTYHHRFWGQLARWSAADRLLPAGNRHVRYGSREAVYFAGEKVELAARLSAMLPLLKDPASARVKVYRKKGDGAEELAAVVPLPTHPRHPATLEGAVKDLPAGEYRVELDIPQFRELIAEPGDENESRVKGRDSFHILPREQTELLDLSTHWALMQSLADRSDGRLYTPENVEELLDRLNRRIERREYRDEQKPWQDAPMVWWMLGFLLALFTLEWGWRRWLELA